MDKTEINKRQLIDKLLLYYSEDKFDCGVEPDLVDFRSVRIRIACGAYSGYIIQFSDDGYEKFDLDKKEFDEIINKTCKFKKK